MIPKEIRQNPELALTDPRFRKQEWIEEFITRFDFWTFGLADEILRKAGDVAIALAQSQGRVLEIKALQCRGYAHRKTNPKISRQSYRQALLLCQGIPSDQKLLAAIYRQLGILEGELNNWDDSDIAHHTCAVLLEKQDRQVKAEALATWGASRLARAFKTGENHLFLAAADVLTESVRKLKQEPREYMIATLANLVTAEMMAGFPEEKLEETFLALQEARSAPSTRKRGPIRTKLTLGIRIHRVKHEEIDLRICWTECYLIIRQQRFEDATVGLRRIRRGFEAIKMHHAAAEIALDEAFCLCLLGKWKQAAKLVRIASKRLEKTERIKDILSAIEQEDMDKVANSFTALAKESGYQKSPAVVAAGLDPDK